MIIGFAVIAIISLIVMALAPEYFIVGIIVLFGLAIWFGIVKLGSTEGQKMITRKTVVAGVVILLVSIVLATVILAGWVKFEIGGPPVNDYKTKEYSNYGWKGTGTFTDGTERSELIDDHFYISSWTDIEESEKIVIQGKLVLDDLGEGLVINGEYKIFATTGAEWGDPVHKFRNLDFPSGAVDSVLFESKIWTIDGNFEGWIKVELHVEFSVWGWRKMAYDCAKVESGKGEVDFVKGIYEIGDMAELELDLGYAKGQYKLEVKALTSGEMLFDGFVDESREGRVTRMEFLVKASHVGIGTWPDCPDNIIEAKLWNELFPKAEDEAAVTDIETLGPQKPTIELSSPADGKAYRTGEIISITVKSEPNLQTEAPVKEYRLRISPGDIVEENTGGTFTFQPAHRGTYKLMVSCQDAVCRRSEVVTKEIHVYDIGEEIDIFAGDFPWSIILILLAGLIGFLITVLVMKDKGVGTVKSMLGGAVVFIIILVVALIFTGEVVI